jgi:hypothetical protein
VNDKDEELSVSTLPDGKDKPDAVEGAEDEQKSRSASKVSEHQNSDNAKLDGAADKEEIEQIKEE